MNAKRAARCGLVVLAILCPLAAAAQHDVTVTVRELFERGHTLEIQPGTQINWADSHFERVWFPPSSGAPRVERVAGGFRAVFDRAGRYRGAFTVVGGHATGDVYGMTVIVRGSSK